MALASQAQCLQSKNQLLRGKGIECAAEIT